MGIDSCMLHAADLARVPGVGLYSPTQPAIWGFRFAPHRHVYGGTMADISVDDVFSAMESLVGELAGTPPRLRNGIPVAVPDEAPERELLSAVRQFHDIVSSWHRKEPETSSASESLATKALHLHAMNFGLWHHEDAVRRTGIGDHEVACRKRRIDDLNARRNAAIEEIDATLLHDIRPNPTAPLHTETPGTIVDRLSVLALRISHTNQAADPGPHLAVLEEQYGDLCCGLEQLLALLRAGDLRFKLYRQYKSAGDRSYCDLYETRDT